MSHAAQGTVEILGPPSTLLAMPTETTPRVSLRDHMQAVHDQVLRALCSQQTLLMRAYLTADQAECSLLMSY